MPTNHTIHRLRWLLWDFRIVQVGRHLWRLPSPTSCSDPGQIQRLNRLLRFSSWYMKVSKKGDSTTYLSSLLISVSPPYPAGISLAATGHLSFVILQCTSGFISRTFSLGSRRRPLDPTLSFPSDQTNPVLSASASSSPLTISVLILCSLLKSLLLVAPLVSSWPVLLLGVLLLDFTWILVAYSFSLSKSIWASLPLPQFGVLTAFHFKVFNPLSRSPMETFNQSLPWGHLHRSCRLLAGLWTFAHYLLNLMVHSVF